MSFFKISLFLLGTASLVNAKAKPNVLFIVSEDNGPELGCYGDKYAKTPTLDKLAEKGVRFENAFVSYSVSSPSRAAFYTGMYPHQNGQIGLATHRFSMYKEFPWIGSYLKNVGYRIGLIGKLHVNPESRFAREWDFRAIKSSNFQQKGRDMKNYATQAAKFINQGDEPFFLTINYPDAHFPVWDQAHGLPVTPQTADEVKPLPWIGVDTPHIRKYTAGYYNCMSRLDTGIKYLLDELKKSGKYDNTLIIYIGDHGAQFSRGKTSVYEAALRIPMIISWPKNVKTGTVSKRLVNTVDILPTILDTADIKVPEYLPGKKLQCLMNGNEKGGGHDVIVGFTTGSAANLYGCQISIRDSRWKLINTLDYRGNNLSANAYEKRLNAHFIAGCSREEIKAMGLKVEKMYNLWLNPPKYELYDLKNDPYEFENLAVDPSFKIPLEKMIEKLSLWQKKYNDPFMEEKWIKKFGDSQENALKRGRVKPKRWEYIDWFSPYAPDTTIAEDKLKKQF